MLKDNTLRTFEDLPNYAENQQLEEPELIWQFVRSDEGRLYALVGDSTYKAQVVLKYLTIDGTVVDHYVSGEVKASFLRRHFPSYVPQPEGRNAPSISRLAKIFDVLYVLWPSFRELLR